MVKSYLRLLRTAVFLSLLMPIVITACSYMGDVSLTGQFYIKAVSLVIAALGFYAVFHFLLLYAYPHLEQLSHDQATNLEHIPTAYLDVAVLGSATLSLFLELTVIRWQAEIFPIFALYKNYSLLTCFLGLGLGYALARGNAIPLFLCIPALVLQFFVLLFLRYGLSGQRIQAIWRTPFTEQLNMGLPTGGAIPYTIANYFFLVVVFTLTTLAFIPVGQLCGKLMTRRENLRAYGFNLLGSLLGVLLVTGISFFWTPPVIWFTMCFALLLVFQRFNSKVLLFGMLVAFFGVAILSWPFSPGLERLHSPYQLLERGAETNGLTSITAAGHYYQRVHDLSLTNANRDVDRALRSTVNYYDLPYRIYGKRPQRVAVVGSGTGNDVAAALRAEAEQIDAIEIDPAILRLGRMYHPEKPYNDPRVNAIVNDARTFIRTTENIYDMVIYGLLDSHTLLSHASNVRLDSFVYTVEAFKEARQHLRDVGLLSLSFAVVSDEIGQKLYLMMKEAFDGIPPLCVRARYDNSIIYLQARNGSLMIDKNLLADAGFEDVTSHYSNQQLHVDVSTDDWPFFYMPKRIYPWSYLGMLGLIFLLSLCTTCNFIREKPAFNNIAFFFLGAGFMLIETKAITELGLTFGNTWQVIGIAICGILLMAFLANCAVQWLRLRQPALSFLLLLASLLLGFLVSKYGGFGSSAAGKIGTVALLTCPMFFSGIVFSVLLARARDITGVMAINLLGAMTGGVLEYNSMYFGFRFLYLLVIALYLLAIGSFYLSSRASDARTSLGTQQLGQLDRWPALRPTRKLSRYQPRD